MKAVAQVRMRAAATAKVRAMAPVSKLADCMESQPRWAVNPAASIQVVVEELGEMRPGTRKPATTMAVKMRKR